MATRQEGNKRKEGTKTRRQADTKARRQEGKKTRRQPDKTTNLCGVSAVRFWAPYG